MTVLFGSADTQSRLFGLSLKVASASIPRFQSARIAGLGSKCIRSEQLDGVRPETEAWPRAVGGAPPVNPMLVKEPLNRGPPNPNSRRLILVGSIGGE